MVPMHLIGRRKLDSPSVTDADAVFASYNSMGTGAAHLVRWGACTIDGLSKW